MLTETVEESAKETGKERPEKMQKNQECMSWKPRMGEVDDAGKGETR